MTKFDYNNKKFMNETFLLYNDFYKKNCEEKSIKNEEGYPQNFWLSIKNHLPISL